MADDAARSGRRARPPALLGIAAALALAWGLDRRLDRAGDADDEVIVRALAVDFKSNESRLGRAALPLVAGAAAWPRAPDQAWLVRGCAGPGEGRDDRERAQLAWARAAAVARRLREHGAAPGAVAAADGDRRCGRRAEILMIGRRGAGRLPTYLRRDTGSAREYLRGDGSRIPR